MAALVRNRSRLTVAVAVCAFTLLATGVSADAARPSRRAKKGKVSERKAATDAAAKSAQSQALDAFQLGVSLYRKDDFSKAAGLFHTAFALDPQAVYLYNAARSEHRGGELKKAAATYRKCAGLLEADPKVVERSQGFLTEIEAQQRKQALAEEQARKLAALKVRKPAPTPDTWKTPVGWASVGTGAVVLAVGGWLLVSAAADQDDLDARTDKRDDQGEVIGIDAESYNSEFDDIERGRTLGIAAGVGGLALAGVGTWLLLTAPSAKSVSIGPAHGGRGIRMALRF